MWFGVAAQLPRFFVAWQFEFFLQGTATFAGIVVGLAPFSTFLSPKFVQWQCVVSTANPAKSTLLLNSGAIKHSTQNNSCLTSHTSLGDQNYVGF